MLPDAAGQVQVTTEEQREGFRTQLTDAEDWLYMDPEAEKGTAETFKAKLQSLTATGALAIHS